jgi:hypothetical protein
VHTAKKRYPAERPSDALHFLLENNLLPLAQREAPIRDRPEEWERVAHEPAILRKFERRQGALNKLFTFYSVDQNGKGRIMNQDQMIRFAQDFEIVSVNKRNNWHFEGLISKRDLFVVFKTVSSYGSVDFAAFQEALRYIAELAFTTDTYVQDPAPARVRVCSTHVPSHARPSSATRLTQSWPILLAALTRCSTAWTNPMASFSLKTTAGARTRARG